MRTRTLLSLAVVGSVALGCQPTSPQSAAAAHTVEVTDQALRCLVSAVIEDGEDNDHQVRAREKRNGYIYSFSDDATDVLPTAGKRGGTFAMAEGGANGSGYSARIKGKMGAGSNVFAGVGFNFVDPKGPYDASKYSGISFYARVGEDSAVTKARLKVPDASTDPDAGVCSECFNDFGIDIELTEEWQRFTVPFDSMRQMAGWGQPRPAAVDNEKIFGVQFQVSSPGSAFDLWVDDIVFTGCL